MKTVWKLLLPVPLALGLLAMMPQGTQGSEDAAVRADVQHALQLSQLQYIDLSGKTVALAARNMLEVRLIDNAGEHLRLEIFYENGDYSLIDVQGFHVIRAGQDVQEVRFTRTKKERLIFPMLR